MDELNRTIESTESNTMTIEQAQSTRKLVWETPKIEDVSEQVMAQPYIRFT